MRKSGRFPKITELRLDCIHIQTIMEEEVFAAAYFLLQGGVQNHSVMHYFNQMQASGQQQQVAGTIALVVQMRNFQGERNIWQWERDQNFFEEMFRNDNMKIIFKQYFRINKETFNNLCEILRPELSKRNTQLRNAVNLEKRVAIAIRRLAKGDSFTSLSMQFGVGSSTCHAICNDFETHLCNIRGDYVKFPVTRDEVQRVINDFQEMSGFPQIAGLIDGTHITILAPSDNKEDYFNRKHQYSVNLMGILDSKQMFLHASVGYPGSIHDSRVLQLSNIYNEIENGDLLSDPITQISGLNIRPQIIGDSAFPDRSWILKPYPDNNRTPTETGFNKKLCGTRVIVEQGFGLLKSRWRILFKKNEQQLSNVARTVTAAVVMHNFCLQNGDQFEEEINIDYDDNQENAVENNICDEARNVRNAICDHLVEQNII